MEFPAFGEEEANSRPKPAAGEELDHAGRTLKPPRRAAIPDFGERPGHAVCTLIEDAVRPAFAIGIFGIITQDVSGGFQNSLRHRLAILRQKQNRAASVTDFRS